MKRRRNDEDPPEDRNGARRARPRHGARRARGAARGPAGSNGKGPQYAPEKPQTPGPGASLPEKAKAYGVYCKGESKKHVKGEKGTPFSRCVTAMAKAAHDERSAARKACKGLSKKHVKGEKGTQFSRCVKAAAQVRKDQA